MIKIVIIEDEIPARKKLRRFIEELDTLTEIVAEIDTVDKGIQFLKNNKADLIFSDIELLDGNAFEIYRQTSILCPIIFTTAYDHFWMEAFEGKGIAYLLKPFSKERFCQAWDKFLFLRNSLPVENKWIASLTELIQQNFIEKPAKKRFTISNHQGIYFVATENIVFFEACEGVVFAHDVYSKKHLLTESTLKEIEEQLSPADFFRINRRELVSKTHIEKIERHGKNTLAIKLKNYPHYLQTSQSNTASFRDWVAK